MLNDVRYLFLQRILTSLARETKKWESGSKLQIKESDNNTRLSPVLSQIAFLILSMVNREEIQFVNTQGCGKMTLHLRDESWDFFQAIKFHLP